MEHSIWQSTRGLALPSPAGSSVRGLKQAGQSCHPPQHTLGCSGKPRGGTASLPGKEAVLDGMAFPNFLAPQPSRLRQELAVVFAKPPAQSRVTLMNEKRITHLEENCQPHTDN